jgi:hypothetical protein
VSRRQDGVPRVVEVVEVVVGRGAWPRAVKMYG